MQASCREVGTRRGKGQHLCILTAGNASLDDRSPYYYFDHVTVGHHLPSLPHSLACNLCPSGISVVLKPLWVLQRQKEAMVDSTHTLFPHVFLTDWRGATLLYDLTCDPIPQIDVNHCFYLPFMTTSINLQQEIMKPILKH